MTVVGEAADGAAVLQQAAAVEPDVVVMDLSMPDMNGLVATRALKQARPSVEVIALTAVRFYESDRSLAMKSYSLLCGYAMGQFYKDAKLGEVCAQHTRVDVDGPAAAAFARLLTHPIVSEA